MGGGPLDKLATRSTTNSGTRNRKNNKKDDVISPLASSVAADTSSTVDDDDDGNNKDSNDIDVDTIKICVPIERQSSANHQHRTNKRVMSQEKLAKEAELTALLFGGGPVIASAAGIGAAAWVDEDDEVNDYKIEGNNNDAIDDGDNLFAIDRSGEDVDNIDDDDDEGEDDNASDDDDDDGDESDEKNTAIMNEKSSKVMMTGAAWRDTDSEGNDDNDGIDSNDDDDDDDDDNDDARIEKSKRQRKSRKGVSLIDGPNRLKKLRRHVNESDPISFGEYETRLRERFVNTASVASRTDWADVGLAHKQQQQQQQQQIGDNEMGDVRIKKNLKNKGYASSSDDESSDDDNDEDAATKIFNSNASLFETTSSNGRYRASLPPTLLDIVRVRDGNLSDPNSSVVSATQFHPQSDEYNPLLMTAGMDKMLRFFRIDGDSNNEDANGGNGGINTKVHGIQFPDMPITCASFVTGGGGGSVVLGGRRPFFYVYDTISGAIQKIPGIVGRKERSLEKFRVSPDGRYIAFIGNDGYVILVDGISRQWIGNLKMNGSVRALTFTDEGEYILGSGSDGDVYRWHIGSRRCVERFHNEDGTITSSLALSSNILAVGAESGVVNLYNERYLSPAVGHRGGGGGGLSFTAIAERKPVKSIMNLTTSVDNVCFNHDGQILALSTRRETNGLKLLHVPTQTVFSNWPTSKTPLKYVWSMDFSPKSRYLAVGNDHGKCLLYRLKYYWDE